MKDGALLVNAARGAIVDTDALLKELHRPAHHGRARRHGPGAAAAEATRCGRRPGLLLTPHVGGAITGARDRAYAVVADQLARYAAGEPLRNVIGPRGY